MKSFGQTKLGFEPHSWYCYSKAIATCTTCAREWTCEKLQIRFSRVFHDYIRGRESREDGGGDRQRVSEMNGRPGAISRLPLLVLLLVYG